MQKKKYKSEIGILLVFFILFAIWQLWIPEALDDWRWGSDVGIQRLQSWFEGYNGRYFGNLIVIALTRMPVLIRSLSESLIMTIALFFVCQLLDKEINSFLIAMVFIIAVPVDILSQTYAWVSGFSNFCVSTTMILGIMVYYYKVLSQQKINILMLILSLVNAFLGSLILENSTIYLIVLSISFVIIYAIKYRKIHKGILAHLIAICIGAVWMFSNSAYKMAADPGNTSQYKEIKVFELSIDWFVSVLKVYADKIIDYWIMPNHILNITTCILILVLVLKNKKKGQYIFTVLFGGYLAFFVFDLMNQGVWKDYISYGKMIQAIIATLYCITLSLFTGWFVNENKDLIILQVILWSQLFFMAPLIIANPISSRCFYSTYIFFAIYLGKLISYSVRNFQMNFEKKYFNIAMISFTIFFMSMNIGIYHFIYKQVNNRQAYIQKEIKKGKSTIRLKKVPLGDVYSYGLDVYTDAWVDTYKEYYDIPKDIQIYFPRR